MEFFYLLNYFRLNPSGKNYRSFSRPPQPLCCLAKSPKSAHAHWVVGKCDNLERAMSLQNVLHLPTTQCTCADFWDFAKQRNGGGSREKDLLMKIVETQK
jgi:hypothetical protein